MTNVIINEKTMDMGAKALVVSGSLTLPRTSNSPMLPSSTAVMTMP